MSRNQNSHFSMIPRANIKRSRFDMSSSTKTTFNAGKLIPLKWWEVLPGDTFEVDTSILARMQTLITPLMDDMYLDLYYFYAPNRLLWQNWQRFCGENDQPWFDEDVQYSVPQIAFSMAADRESAGLTVKKGTVADYLGLPMPVPDSVAGDNGSMVRVSHLPFRMYARVWNEWFRSENLQNMAAFTDYDTGTTMNSAGQALYGGELLPVNKYRDAYTSALPSPQRGPEVTIGVGDVAPIFTTGVDNSWETLAHGSESPVALHWKRTSANGASWDANNHMLGVTALSEDSTGAWTFANSANATVSTRMTAVPSNLYADISAATGISINELRLAFATQRYYETLARSGSRYIELLDGVFGVQAPDQRLQRTEYLGGNRVHVNVNQTIQQSETNTTPLGNVGAYSLTVDNQNSFTKSFVEHGILMAFCCIRYDHSYQDGINRQWFREDFFDYYNPLFANIGEQPIKNRELFANGSSTDDEVFGYQEAWYEYRYGQNNVTSEFRSRYAQTLDYWHLADNYTSMPRLSEDWIKEDGNVVDRAIAVSQRVSDQFMADFYFNIKATRPMPLYSVPGLDIL